ncbi:MAG TPA: fasciclin domain-containing protein [Methanoculleus sp.]|nr:fasciclin domain-containing protein [Methanoculleus sp.]
MALKRVFGIFAVICILALAGPVVAVQVPEDQSQFVFPGEIREAGAAVAFAKGDYLADRFPENMEVIGRYNVTIDPAEVFKLQPFNLDNPIEVKRDTPIGALDAVARTGALNYSTYLYSTRNLLVIDHINGHLYQGDWLWLVVYENGSYITSTPDMWDYSISNGETIWLIYCDLTDFNSRYESRLDRAVAGLSITTTHGKSNVTPGPVTPEPVAPGPVTPEPVTPGPVTPGPATPGPVTPEPVEGMNLIDVIAENDNLSFFAVLLNATDLVTTLQSGGPYTVFAPSNDAFGNMPREAFASLLTDDGERMRVLSAHVVNGSYTTADLLNVTRGGNTTTVETLAGGNLTISANGSVLSIDNATIVAPDINASNGVVHVIDRVLSPPAEGPGPTVPAGVVLPPTTPATVTPVPAIPALTTPPLVTPMLTMPTVG